MPLPCISCGTWGCALGVTVGAGLGAGAGAGTRSGGANVFICALNEDLCVAPEVWLGSGTASRGSDGDGADGGGTAAAGGDDSIKGGGASTKRKRPTFACSFSVSPALPVGIYLESSLGILYGRPAEASVAMTVVDHGSHQSEYRSIIKPRKARSSASTSGQSSARRQ